VKKARSTRKVHKVKVTLRQQSANALKDFVYADGKVIGESRFVGPGKYLISLRLPTGNVVDTAKTRSAVRSKIQKFLRKRETR
jgi:hypothetical protein